ncbi:hypothetical protein ABZ771_34330 [Streptomyces globisporus]|uniref:hypothetical protein n=1 Tax=Streptomyces globisporus TaxID=1908 RepID=UPI003460621E
MKVSLAANAAPVEVRPLSSEFVLSSVLLFGCFLVLASLTALLLVVLSRRLGTSPTAAPPVPPAAPDPGMPSGSPSAMLRWTIAGVVVGAIGVIITALGVFIGL